MNQKMEALAEIPSVDVGLPTGRKKRRRNRSRARNRSEAPPVIPAVDDPTPTVPSTTLPDVEPSVSSTLPLCPRCGQRNGAPIGRLSMVGSPEWGGEKADHGIVFRIACPDLSCGHATPWIENMGEALDLWREHSLILES